MYLKKKWILEGNWSFLKLSWIIYAQFGFAWSYISQKPFLCMALRVEKMRNLCGSHLRFSQSDMGMHRAPGRLQLALTRPCPISCSSTQMLPLVNRGPADSWWQKLRSNSYTEAQILKALSIEPHLSAWPWLSSQIAPTFSLKPALCEDLLVILQIIILQLRNSSWFVTKPQKGLNIDHGYQVPRPSEMSVVNRMLCSPLGNKAGYAQRGISYISGGRMKVLGLR